MTNSSYLYCRYQPPRQHKKTSFAIINEYSPNQSRPPSPTGGRTSPFRGKGFRASSSIRHMRPVSCPESPRSALHLTDRPFTDDQVINKPSVHFKIAPAPRRKTADANISLEKKHDEINQSLTDLSYQDRDMEGFELNPDDQFKSNQSSRRDSLKSIYPELPRKKPSPAPRRFVHKSANDLLNEAENDLPLDTPLVNPRSYHKGLLRVVSTGQSSPSKIPRRKSSISRPGDMSSSRKNSLTMSTGNLSSRVSPKRKMSNEFGGSMIDLGVASSTLRSASRISKPTTLSPIIGTPNRDGEHENMAGNKSADQSPTKIPIRRSSSINIHGSRNNSRASSREHSPPKNTTRSPTKIPQKMPQRTSQSDNKTSKKQTINVKPPASKNEKTGPLKREASDIRKQPSSARKEPAITHEKSSAKKPIPQTLKRETSTLRKPSSTLKREPSNLKLPSTLKRESSTVGKRQTPSSSMLSKNQSDSSLTKRLDKKNSFKQKRRTSSESDGFNEKDTANTDNLISLGMPAAAMVSSVVTNKPSPAVTNQLNKTSSSGQITHNNSSNNILSSNVNNNTIPLGGDDNVAETIKKPVETTDKTHKPSDTPSEVATEAVQKTTEDSAMEVKASETDTTATVQGTPSTAPLQKIASTRTLKSELITLNDDKVVIKTEETAATGLPIEAEVNVINKDENSGGASNDTDKNMTEDVTLLKQINVEASNDHIVTQAVEMEVDSPNLNSNDLAKQAINGVKSTTLQIDSSAGAKNGM